MKLKLFVLILSSILAVAKASARELFEYQRPISALGMGGVYLPFVKETDAVLWNPAVLSQVDSLSWEIIDIGAGINGLDMMTSIQDATGCSGGATCFDSLYGKPIWVGYHGKTSFVGPYFGVTGFSMGSLEGTLHNPAYPNFQLTFLNDSGFAAGTAVPLGPLWSLGVSVKRIQRWGGTQDVGLDAIASGSTTALTSGFNDKGTGYGFDLGTQFKIPGPLSTILAVHWQDVGSTAFLKTDGDQAPPRIKDNLSLGLGTELDLPGLDWRLGLEYRHITLQGEQIGKKLHFGTELSLPLIDLRAGLNQGYPTLGLGFDLFILRFDVASYTEETGVYPGQTPSSRIKAGITLDLSVDANFKFTTSDGKKRKLKQRR